MLFKFNHVTQITSEQCSDMLNKWMENNYDQSIPHCEFWCCEEDENGIMWYTVIDNIDGTFLMESFRTPEAAHAWLRSVDVDVCYKIESIILESE